MSQLSKEWLEQQYSPSSCIDDINVFIKAYSQLSASAKAQAVNAQSVITDIQYGHCKAASLDLFLPTQGNSQQLHVYIHGGYWQALSKEESCFAATNFQQQGHHFAVLNYSLAPSASLEQIVDQNRQALEWLYHHANQYGYNKEQIYLSGSSAGAHLALMMLLTNWQSYADIATPFIKGICAVSGIYDLSPLVSTYINKPLQLSQNEINNNSPLLMNLGSGFNKGCRVIFGYGDNETSEFKRQSNEMYMKLKSLGYQVTLKEVANRNHFDVILDIANQDTWLAQQVAKQMNSLA